jgi:hypothetical protein
MDPEDDGKYVLYTDYEASERHKNQALSDWEAAQSLYLEAQQRIAALEQQVAELGRDAGRYRFVRNADRSDKYLPWEQLISYSMKSLDEAIDAAMAQEKEHG